MQEETDFDKSSEKFGRGCVLIVTAEKSSENFQ